jgi:hypothetical protein
VSNIAIPFVNGVLFKCIQYARYNIDDSYRSHTINCSLTMFYIKYEGMFLVHLRTKFYLSDSESLIIIAVCPEGNKIALLLC